MAVVGNAITSHCITMCMNQTTKCYSSNSCFRQLVEMQMDCDGKANAVNSNEDALFCSNPNTQEKQDLTGTLVTPPSIDQVAVKTLLETIEEDHGRFFTEMLGDIDGPTFPFGLRDVDMDGAEINKANLKLPQNLNDQLRKHARNLHVNMNSFCHLTWAQVLARGSGCEKVVFGSVLSSRFLAEERENNIVRSTVKILPIQIDVDERFVETVVRNTHARLNVLLAHEHTSLVLAQRFSEIHPDLSLFSALLNYRRHLKSNHLTQSPHGDTFLDQNGRTNYPLYLSVEDDDNSLSLTAQIIFPLAAKRICAYMQQALESLAEALAYTPQQPVRKLAVIPPEERKLLLHTWNQTRVDYSLPHCLHQIFEMQVGRDGDAIAVECNGKVLSYSELNTQANRLAHYLLRHGVQPDDRIALCVERSTKLIVAILGILKAGGAYVPLDPKYPSQRSTTILKDSDPLLLLTDATGRAILGDHEVPTMNLEEPLPTDLPVENPDQTQVRVTSSNLAYIIYTSGSTGIPKGVMVEHRNAANCIHWINESFTAEDFAHTAFSTSVNFDMSLYECFAALSMGSTLHVIPDALAISTSKTSIITAISTVPSALTTLLNVGQSLPTSLRTLHLIGEPLKSSLVERVFTQTHVNELCNLYGLTETSFLSTMHRFKPGDEAAETIGRPIANTQIYLLDAHGEPVSLGAEGEIYVGGANVARGYLNRPELTAERFLSDPFSDSPAARMYRTGDRARYLPNGDLICLGRVDQQVKIRGFRIELGEIESRIVEHSQVRDAVVEPYGNGSDVQLVAYIVADSNALLAQNLRNYLLKLLPSYMVPAAYVCLPSLPHTPNGKLDRRALPAPNEEAFARDEYEAPQGEIEEMVVHIWSELLGIDRISRNDNFFALGGHSLLVPQFVSKAKLCNINVDVRGVYAFPILKEFTEQILKCGKRTHCDAAIPVRQHGHERPLFLMAGGRGGIPYAFELARDIDESVPIYVLPWSLPEKKQPSSIEEMAAAMISLIKKVQANGPYSIAGFSAGGILAYEVAKQLLSSGHTVSFLGLIDTYPITDNLLTETQTFLTDLILKFPIMKTINDSKWWNYVSKLTFDEAIDEIRKMSIDLEDVDMEWEILLSKQRYNHQNLCSSLKFESLPITIHLFKAIDQYIPPAALFDNDTGEARNEYEAYFNRPKLGWENYIDSDIDVIPIDGHHLSMMKDPKNRSMLGREISKFLISPRKTNRSLIQHASNVLKKLRRKECSTS